MVWQVAATADEAEEPSSSALMHGATYQNAKALAILGTWLATTLRSAGGGYWRSHARTRQMTVDQEG